MFGYMSKIQTQPTVGMSSVRSFLDNLAEGAVSAFKFVEPLLKQGAGGAVSAFKIVEPLLKQGAKKLQGKSAVVPVSYFMDTVNRLSPFYVEPVRQADIFDKIGAMMVEGVKASNFGTLYAGWHREIIVEKPMVRTLVVKFVADCVSLPLQVIGWIMKIIMLIAAPVMSFVTDVTEVVVRQNPYELIAIGLTLVLLACFIPAVMRLLALDNYKSLVRLMAEVDEHPQTLICPITLEIMEDPVYIIVGSERVNSQDGEETTKHIVSKQAYERQAIMKHFARGVEINGVASCPLTKLIVEQTDLIPANDVWSLVEEYRRNCEPPPVVDHFAGHLTQTVMYYWRKLLPHLPTPIRAVALMKDEVRRAQDLVLRKHGNVTSTIISMLQTEFPFPHRDPVATRMSAALFINSLLSDKPEFATVRAHDRPTIMYIALNVAMTPTEAILCAMETVPSQTYYSRATRQARTWLAQLETPEL
jgi:hypothetical protein